MKFFSRVRKFFSKRVLVAAAAIGAAALIPVASLSAANIRFEMTMGVANVTAGDTTYKRSVNASYDQIVKVQVYYHNMEDPTSNKVANDVRLKINVPTAPGKNQTVSGTMSSPDINTVQDSVSVALDRDDAYLEYIPGSAVWKHNAGTNENINNVEQKISDEVVFGSQGLVIEDVKPCFNFDATVTILMRVRVPGVKIVKQSRVKGSGQAWSNNNTAKPGDTMEYLITYQNIGNAKAEDVVIRDSLPPKLQYVAGSTYLANETNPNGVKYNSDNLTNGGIVVGDYGPGANAFVKFEAKIPDAEQLACGTTDFRNVAVAKPAGMNEYYNTAITIVNRECANQPKQPVCESLTLNKMGDRKVQATVKYNPNGATFRSVTFQYGDATDGFVTNQTSNNEVKSQVHQYAKDGEYTVSAAFVFTVDGKDVVVSGNQCAAKVSYVTPTTPTTPTTLPNTGAGDVIGIVAATTVAGALAHRFLYGRKQTV